jgi:hypothetical protein
MSADWLRWPRLAFLRVPRGCGGAVVLALAFAQVSCGGSAGLPDGPSPLTELQWLGEVNTRAQSSPGKDLARHWMPILQAPVAPPRGHGDVVPMADDELVVGLVLDGTAVAYPIRYLTLAEVVNDSVAGTPVVVSWCPLAGSAAVFRRDLENGTAVFHFGTGLLHDNLLLVDEATASVWSQLAREAVDGPMVGTRLEAIPSLQTTWRFWRKRWRDTEVMFFPGEEGRGYHYADFEPGDLPYPPPAAHDPSSMGLGVVDDDGTAWFFPLRSLKEAGADEGLALDELPWTAHYSEQGITAWLEGAEGRLLDGQLAYERAWLPFHPESRVLRGGR